MDATVSVFSFAHWYVGESVLTGNEPVLSQSTEVVQFEAESSSSDRRSRQVSS
jgi:hypothetical protein